MVSKMHAAALTAGLSSFDTEDSAEVTAEALSRSRAPAVMNPPGDSRRREAAEHNGAARSRIGLRRPAAHSYL